jgi:hypothetical protein
MFRFRFKTSEKKSLYEAVETIIASSSPAPSLRGVPTLRKGGMPVQYFLDIVLERDIRNQAGISVS